MSGIHWEPQINADKHGKEPNKPSPRGRVQRSDNREIGVHPCSSAALWRVFSVHLRRFDRAFPPPSRKTLLRSEFAASRNDAAFHDCPGMPIGSPVRPWNHSLNCQLLAALARARLSSAERALRSLPIAASAMTQNPPTSGQQPPLWYW